MPQSGKFLCMSAALINIFRVEVLLEVHTWLCIFDK